MVDWVKKAKIDPLVDLLQEARQGASYTAFGFSFVRPLLFLALDFEDEIPDPDAWSALTGALFDFKEEEPLHKGKLLTKIRAREAEYLGQTRQPFVVATTISIPHPYVVTSTQLGDCRFTFGRSLPARFQEQREDASEKLWHVLRAKEPPIFGAVRVHVRALSASDAANRALERLHLLRGIWNLAINRRLFWRETMAGGPESINQIRLGPLQTIHHPSGKLATETFWYQPRYIDKHGQKLPPPLDWKRIRAFEKTVRSKLRRCSYARLIESWIIRYCEACDDDRWDTAYLGLWSVLESSVVDWSRDRPDGETIIRRAAFIFGHDTVETEILHGLARYRHRRVHTEYKSEYLKNLLWTLKRYSEEAIGFHLAEGHRFSSFHEATQLLGHPQREKLEAQIEKKRAALSYLDRREARRQRRLQQSRSDPEASSES